MSSLSSFLPYRLPGCVILAGPGSSSEQLGPQVCCTVSSQNWVSTMLPRTTDSLPQWLSVRRTFSLYLSPLQTPFNNSELDSRIRVSIHSETDAPGCGCLFPPPTPLSVSFLPCFAKMTCVLSLSLEAISPGGWGISLSLPSPSPGFCRQNLSHWHYHILT